MSKRPKLMIPGPVDVWEETLDAMGQQVRPHYGAEWMALYRETIVLLQRVFQTRHDILIMTAPGSGALEAGLSSLFASDEKVAVVNNGPFAMRSIEILKAYGCRIISVENEWGKPGDLNDMQEAVRQHPDLAGIVVVASETGTGVRNPVQPLAQLAHEHGIPIFVDAVSAMGGYHLPVDAWELDVVCTSSNKALEAPPGLGLISVNDRAWQVIEAKKNTGHHGWYFDLSLWKRYRDAQPHSPYPTTMATSLITALRASVKRILEEETLEGHWARYAWAQRVMRAGLRNLGFTPLVADEDATFTVTTVRKRDDMKDEHELRDFLEAQYGFMFGGAGGPLAGNTFRVGHMGKASTREYLIPCLMGIEDFVRTVKGKHLPLGASLIGLEEHGTGY